MESREILKRAIDKASENGFEELDYLDVLDGGVGEVNARLEDIEWSLRFKIIYSHDFAKAFFGQEFHPKFTYAPEFRGETQPIQAWKFHLQQIVLEDDPIKYLEKFL